MLPDKELEERVLCDCSEYLANNLPADDVASVMLSKSLLTSKEHDEYKAMKRSGRSTMTCMSEYLLECLRKREAGFLKKFSGILWEIEPAKYLSDYIQRAYREASLHGGKQPHKYPHRLKRKILNNNYSQDSTHTLVTVCQRLASPIRISDQK